MCFSRFVTGFLLASVSLLSAQTFSILVNFDGTNGSGPDYVTLVQGRDGRLYGTTYGGGTNGLGAVIRINLTTQNSIVVHSFDGTNGSNPGAGVTLATDGYFYGTTVFGGSANLGVLYKVNPAGTYVVLHQFAGGSDGEYPYGPPIQAGDGNFYGATSGIPNSSNATIYRLTSSGVYSVIYTFDQPTSGVAPLGLTQGTDSLLYATANVGGSTGCGTIVELTTSGVLKETHTFPCRKGGANPVATPMQASDGNFYGTTQNGGFNNGGTLYQLTGVFGLNVLHDFGVTPGDGSNADAGLVQGSDGNLYSVTYTVPVIYSWNLASGGYTVLYTLGSGFFISSLMQDTNGRFYGTSELDGTHSDGYVYVFDMGLGPFVTFVRSQGKVGAIAQILGQGLTGTTAVTFNGVPASFSVVSDTYMTAVVPAGAATGPVTVTTPSGTLTSNKNFRVTQ